VLKGIIAHFKRQKELGGHFGGFLLELGAESMTMFGLIMDEVATLLYAFQL
jgi:hypothetical protein